MSSDGSIDPTSTTGTTDDLSGSFDSASGLSSTAIPEITEIVIYNSADGECHGFKYEVTDGSGSMTINHAADGAMDPAGASPPVISTIYPNYMN